MGLLLRVQSQALNAAEFAGWPNIEGQRLMQWHGAPIRLHITIKSGYK
jgi:hypothetical protein